MESLKNLHHNIYEGKQFTYKIFSIKDCSAKKKEYEPYQGSSILKEIPNLGYINIQIGKYPIMITTPTMVCPFGFNKSTGQLTLQFTNVKTIALGGINQNNIKLLKSTKVEGYASINWIKKNRPTIK